MNYNLWAPTYPTKVRDAKPATVATAKLQEL